MLYKKLKILFTTSFTALDAQNTLLNEIASIDKPIIEHDEINYSDFPLW